MGLLRQKRHVLIAVVALSVESLLGCENGTTSTSIKTGPTLPLAAFVTEDVQHSIDPQGHFVDDHAPLSAEYPEISSARASELATAFVRDFAPWVESALISDRGGAVHLAELLPCGRQFYAASAYEAPPSGATPMLRKVVGPHWLIPFCAGGTEEVLVGVSAYATEVSIDKRGRIERFGNANFTLQGVPIGLELPIPPEKVAQDIATRSHQAISMVPE